MRLSQYFIPTLKETPSEAKIASHRLMLRAGMIRMASAGVYNWLPLGLKVLRKVENIIREEMNAAGANEILMPVLNSADLWKETGRWDKYEEGLMFRLQDRHKRDFCLGPTHEEAVTDIFRQNVQSYKQLPITLYQIQTKFRDEFRPRFGLMRGREFLMKDAYSFDVDREKALESYEKMRQCYHKIFKKLGLDYRQVLADTGDIGGEYSHEFQVLAGAGEDDLLFDPEGDYAVNVEKYDPATAPRPKEELQQKKGIEVGHIFLLEDTYTKPMKVNAEINGENKPVQMGCYGIGVSRIVAAAIEQNHDENGIVWPAPMAPYQVGVICLKMADAETKAAAEKIYATLQQKNIEVLYDDRDMPAGAKFADMDLIGLPWQCVLGPKGVQKNVAEWKNRKTGETQELPLGELPQGV